MQELRKSKNATKIVQALQSASRTNKKRKPSRFSSSILFLRVGHGRNPGRILRPQRKNGRAAGFGHTPARRVIDHEEFGQRGVVGRGPRATQPFELGRGLMGGNLTLMELKKQ